MRGTLGRPSDGRNAPSQPAAAAQAPSEPSCREWVEEAPAVHWALAIVALTLLAFAAISGRIAGTPITAAMVFTAVGLLVGSEALGLIEVAPAGETVKLLAEATLALVLFADASRIDVRALRGELSVPLRLLGIGLPLTLVAGIRSSPSSCSPSSRGPRRCSWR